MQLDSGEPIHMCTAPVSEGEILAGRYRVERVLGVGGMGVVVAAVHVQLGQRVAVKFLRAETCQHPDVGMRFLREARAAARIQSEHVGRVIDFGTLDSGAPYMVMEYLSGVDLSRLVGQHLPVEQAIEYVLQACEGIAEAHAIGVVHRDIKPANLFVTQRSDGSPLLKVLDFGISKAKDEDSTLQTNVSMTVTGAVLGSPAYMSPEQVRSAKDIDSRADIWALGVVLHELLAGRPVYQADTLSALLAMIAADPPAPLRTLRPEVPLEVERIVLRCLSKQRDQRFADVGELAQALKPFGAARAAVHADRARDVLRSTRNAASGMSGSVTEGSVDAASARVNGGDSVPASVVSRWRGASGQQLRRHRIVLLWATGLVLSVGAVFFWFGASRKRQDANWLDGNPSSVAAASVNAARSPETSVSADAAATIAVPIVTPVTLSSATPIAPTAIAPTANANLAKHRDNASAGPALSAREAVGRSPAPPSRAPQPTPAGASAALVPPPAPTPAHVPANDRGANPF